MKNITDLSLLILHKKRALSWPSASASNALKEETDNNFVNSTFDGCTKMFSSDQI